MPQKRLRIVKKSPPPAIGVCERCNVQFKAYTETEIPALFDAHTCKLK